MTFTTGDAAFAGQILGLITQTAGSFYSVKSQKRQFANQADMAEINARIAGLSARSELAAGRKEAARAGLMYGKLKSDQRAALAASGVDLGYGTAAELQAETDFIKEVDLNQIEANALSRAWSHRLHATDLRGQAMMARANAKSVKPSLSAFNTLLTGAGQVADSWYSANKQGTLSTFSYNGGKSKTGAGIAKTGGWK